jgi:hypothetical protein
VSSCKKLQNLHSSSVSDDLIKKPEAGETNVLIYGQKK